MGVVSEAHYLAEWYLPELDSQSVESIVAKLEAAATTVSGEGTPVRLLVTLAVPTDEVLYGVFGADSPDVVSRTCVQAGFPHQRLSGDVGARIARAAQLGAISEPQLRNAEPEPSQG